MALLISTSVCVPSYNDAVNDLLDLEHDLHANDFSLK